MRNIILKATFMSAVCALVVAGMTGCSTTVKSLGSGEDLAAQSTETKPAVVLGKFRLVKNGEDVPLGNGIFANNATLHLYCADSEKEVNAKVGPNGEFAWALEPGSYRISNIEFMVRGEPFAPATSFEFVADANNEATYVGTITLVTTGESGYYGLDGVIDSSSIDDDCDSDCAGMLARLDMNQDAATVSLIRAEK